MTKRTASSTHQRERLEIVTGTNAVLRGRNQLSRTGPSRLRSLFERALHHLDGDVGFAQAFDEVGQGSLRGRRAGTSSSSASASTTSARTSLVWMGGGAGAAAILAIYPASCQLQTLRGEADRRKGRPAAKGTALPRWACEISGLNSMSKNTESPLLAAARALSDDLERFEKLSGELSRLVINSDKSLQRACRGLLECSEHETKLAQSLRGFAEAMQGMQESQQRCMEQAAAATERVRQRQLQRSQLQERLQVLSQKASEISSPAGALPESPNPGSADVMGPLQEVARRLELVIAEAAEISELARTDDWTDVERDTRSLEQQLLAAKNRINLSLSKLAKDAPS